MERRHANGPEAQRLADKNIRRALLREAAAAEIHGVPSQDVFIRKAATSAAQTPQPTQRFE